MWNKGIKKLDFLPLFSLCFCLGIFLVRFFFIPFLILYIGCFILVILNLIFLKKDKSEFLLLILAVFLGALFLKNSYTLSSSHIIRFSSYKSELALLEGKVDSYPEISNCYTSFILSAKELSIKDKVYKVNGRVLIRIFHKENIFYGQMIRLKGKLKRPFRYKSTRFSYKDYLGKEKIYSIFTVSSYEPVIYLGFKKVNPLKILAYRIRNIGLNIYFSNLPKSQAGMFSAIVLGDRSQLAPYLKRLFVQTGTVHILAISGLHIGIVGFVLNLLLKALGARRRIRFLIIIFCLVFYCFLTGSRASVIRATIMATVLLATFFLKKEVKISNSLSLAALIILAINPFQLFDIGFQLSFISVIAIAYVSGKFKSLIFRTKLNKVLEFFVSALSVSFSVWLGLLPFILYYFRIINPVAIIANIIVVPYLTLVIALGLTLLISGFIFPNLVFIFAQPANLAIIVLIKIIQFFNNLPFGYFYLK